MRDGALLSLHLLNTAFQIRPWDKFDLLHTRNEEWRVREQIIHLFEGTFGCLREEAIEKYRIRQVAHLRIESVRYDSSGSFVLTMKTM